MIVKEVMNTAVATCPARPRRSRSPESSTVETGDVLIAGGGPAGSACAWRLRAVGLDVARWLLHAQEPALALA